MKFKKYMLAGLLVARYILRGQNTRSVEIAVPASQQWEYGFYVNGGTNGKTLNEWGEGNNDSQTAMQNWINKEHASCLEIVNRLGKLGWELTGVNTTQRAPYVIYIFKRPTRAIKIHQHHNGNGQPQEKEVMRADHVGI